MVQGWGGPQLLPSYESRAPADRVPQHRRGRRRWPATSARPRSARRSTRIRRPGEAARREAAAVPQRRQRRVRLARRAAWRALRRARRSSSPTARRRPTIWSTTGRAARRAAARRMSGSATAATSAIRCSTASDRASPCCGSALVRRAADGLLAAFRARGVPVRAGGCASPAGARSLRARPCGRAAGPARRLARQYRSAGRRAMIVARMTDVTERVKNKRGRINHETKISRWPCSPRFTVCSRGARIGANLIHRSRSA